MRVLCTLLLFFAALVLAISIWRLGDAMERMCGEVERVGVLLPLLRGN